MSTQDPVENPVPVVPPPQPPRSEDTLWLVFSHISVLLGVGLVLPLIVYLVKKDEGGIVPEQAKEALNFHISLLIYSLVCGATCVGAPLIAGVALFGLIFAIVAAIKVSKGIPYRYPLTIRLVR